MNRAGLFWIFGGLSTLAAAVFYRKEISHAASDVVDLVIPTKTGKRKIDEILPLLQKASLSSGVPLGLMIGWISKESGGRLEDTTSLDERGYFQLHPDESKSLGLDHQRLSTDPDYSIAGGVALIKSYMQRVQNLGVAAPGSSYFWRLVKLFHTMGSGAAAQIIAGAKAAGAAGSWEALEQHAMDNEQKYFSLVKHSPSKWFPLVDKVYDAGRAFGFGSGTTLAGDALLDEYWRATAHGAHDYPGQHEWEI